MRPIYIIPVIFKRTEAGIVQRQSSDHGSFLLCLYSVLLLAASQTETDPIYNTNCWIEILGRDGGEKGLGGKSFIQGIQNWRFFFPWRCIGICFSGKKIEEAFNIF